MFCYLFDWVLPFARKPWLREDKFQHESSFYRKVIRGSLNLGVLLFHSTRDQVYSARISRATFEKLG